MKNKLTEEKIEQILQELIEEGLLDRLKSKASGVAAGLKQGAKNFSAFMKGDASAIEDPKAKKAQAQFISKLSTIAKDLKSAQDDMAILFPADSIENLPGDLPALVSNYQKTLSVMNNSTQKMLSQIQNPPAQKDNTKQQGGSQPQQKGKQQPQQKGKKQPQQKGKQQPAQQKGKQQPQQKQPNRNPATGRFVKKGEPARDPKTGRFVKKTLEELLKQYR